MTGAGRAWPRHCRVHRRADFLACYERGAKFHSSHFILHVLFVPGMSARCGMAVSHKVGNAVARNRVKRLLREFFRLNMFDLASVQIVAVAKRNAASLNFASVTAELEPLFKRVKERGGSW